jgi:hypothetical protein
MREIRSYGSVRGVRSNPYPYRDQTTADAKHRRDEWRAVQRLLTLHSGSTPRSRDHLTTEDGDGSDGSCVVTGLALQDEDPSGTDRQFDENPR